MTASIPQNAAQPLVRIFTTSALAEAVTWAGLLVGMFLDHVVHVTHAVVWLFGRLHGGVFVVYVVVTVVVARQLRWSVAVTVLALAAAVPPLMTWPLERWLRRSGRHVGQPHPEAGCETPA